MLHMNADEQHAWQSSIAASSFVYNLKPKGPIFEPCEKPYSNFNLSEDVPLYLWLEIYYRGKTPSNPPSLLLWHSPPVTTVKTPYGLWHQMQNYGPRGLNRHIDGSPEHAKCHYHKHYILNFPLLGESSYVLLSCWSE